MAVSNQQVGMVKQESGFIVSDLNSTNETADNERLQPGPLCSPEQRVYFAHR